MSFPRRTIQLRTLGALAVDTGDESGQRSRRALALLALAAGYGPDGVNRESVVALLWPESDAERAANSFRQVLHGIRRELGEGALVYDSGRLSLNPTLFTVDLWNFNRALEANDLEGAAALYRGPFLAGFHIAGLHEFARWAETERDRLRQTAVSTLQTLARRASDSGDYRESARWWRSAGSIDPLSSTTALGLLQALAASGDRTGALNYARVYESLVRSELETEPDDDVLKYVALLKHTSPDGTRPRATPPQPIVAAPAAEEAQGPAAPAATPELPDPSDRRPVRVKLGRVGVFSAAGLTLIAAIAAGRWSTSLASGPNPSPNGIAVFPFRAYASADTSLGTVLSSLVTADLDGAGDLHTVSPGAIATVSKLDKTRADGIDLNEARALARQLGAGVVVTGDIVEHGGGVRVSIVLHDTRRGGRITDQIVVEGDTASLVRMSDELAGRVIATRYRQPAQHLTQVASAATRSIPALKAFLRGEIALREGRYIDALDAYREATVSDSAFALAYYRMSIAGDWCGRVETADSASELAIRYSDRLNDRERRLISAYAAWRDGRSAVAEQTYRSILDDYPDDADAWFGLGEALFHNNPLRGRSVVDAKPALERAVSLDSTNVEAIIHLARIAALQQHNREADALERRAINLVRTPGSLESRAFRTFALSDRPGLKRVTQDLERGAPTSLGTGTLLDVAIDADDVAGTEQFARALVNRASSAASRAFGLRLLAHAALAQGRWAETRVLLDSAIELVPGPGIAQLSLAATLPFVPMSHADLAHVRELVRNWSPTVAPDSTGDPAAVRRGRIDAQVRLHRLGILSVRLGDFDGARRMAAELDAMTTPSRDGRRTHTLAQSIRAWIAAAQGHLVESLAALDAADWESAADVFAAEAADRYLRATILQSLGRTQEASTWFSSIAERAAYELPYVAPSQMHLAEIAEQEGHAEAARTYAARAASLWRQADVAMRASSTGSLQITAP
jgi:DNA-binding SARP family transcriptional activator/tetratricopeptide (TPR) repeat protein